MMTVRKALARATYQAAFSSIRAARDADQAYSAPVLRNMPYLPRAAAAQAFLASCPERQVKPLDLAGRVANLRATKEMFPKWNALPNAPRRALP